MRAPLLVALCLSALTAVDERLRSVKNLAKGDGAVGSRSHGGNDALGKAARLRFAFVGVGEFAFDQAWTGSVRKVPCNEGNGGLAPELYRLGAGRRRNREERSACEHQFIHRFPLRFKAVEDPARQASQELKTGLVPATCCGENSLLITAIFSRTHCLFGQQKTIIAGEIHLDVKDRNADVSPNPCNPARLK